MPSTVSVQKKWIQDLLTFFCFPEGKWIQQDKAILMLNVHNSSLHNLSTLFNSGIVFTEIEKKKKQKNPLPKLLSKTL